MAQDLRRLSNEELASLSAFNDSQLAGWIKRLRKRIKFFDDVLTKGLLLDDELARRRVVDQFNDGPCRFGEVDYEDETRGGHEWVDHPADEDGPAVTVCENCGEEKKSYD